MLSERKLHIIDSIVNGQPLNPEDLNFYEDVKDDVDFKREMAFRQDMKVSLSVIGRQSMKSHLRKLDKKSGKASKLWGVLLSLILIAVSIYLIKNYYSRDRQDYYAQYFEPYPNVVDPLTKGDSQLSSGYLEYEKQNYDEALSLLQKEQGAASLFYQGMIYNIQEEHENAEEAYRKALTLNEPSMNDKIEWYLSLTLDKLGKKEQAQSIWSEIFENRNHFYRQKVSGILKGK